MIWDMYINSAGGSFGLGQTVSLEGMSTRAEPYRKYVAQDEKSKIFIFFPEIAYDKPRNVV